MTAATRRARARASLNKNWGYAILASLIALFLGASIPGYGLTFVDVLSTGMDKWSDYTSAFNAFGNIFNNSAHIGIVFSVLTLVIGGCMNLGLVRYNQNLYHGRKAGLDDLFEHFNNFGNAFLLNLFIYLFVFLWTLLLIIPGIVMSYAYSQAFFIMQDDPSIAPLDAIKKSKEMMYGKKWDLFCLDLSFIGWAILSALTCGIGFLFLSPYMMAARTSFYNEVAGTACDPMDAPASDNGSNDDNNSSNSNDNNDGSYYKDVQD